MESNRLEQIDEQIIAIHIQQRHLRQIEHELFAEKMEILSTLGKKTVDETVEIEGEKS